jgi:NADPH-dependent glutamate synthase beta subunit-like oxidoreductase
MSALDSAVIESTPFAPVANLPTTSIETGTWKYLEPSYKDKLPPCSHACPAGNDISKAMTLLASGDLNGAARLLRSGNPLLSTLGRICPHPCERQCNRESFGGAIAVHMLERFLGDASVRGSVPMTARRSGRKVAVIGSGPAGIAAAYSLALLGHEVEVFDDKQKPGGYLRTGIPDYRLPQRILDNEIALVEQTGVKFNQSIRVGRDLTFQELRSRFHAVILAVGLHASRSLGIPRSNHPHVYDGVQLLEDILLGRSPSVPRKIAVVGGGNTAVDVARSLLRMGVRPTIVYRRTETEMPAIAAEVEQAKLEGVEFRFLAAPSAVIVEADAVVGLECHKMRLGEPDSSGRRAPVRVLDSTFRIPVSGVVAAIGETVDAEFLPESLRTQLADNLAGVFLAGDAATGEGTATAAVGSGRRVAAAVDRYLKDGRKVEEEPTLQSLWQRRVDASQVADLRYLNPAYFAPEARPQIRTKICQAPTSFTELVESFSVESALSEARRCLACGTCNGCLNCYYLCPDIAIRGRSEADLHVDSAHCKGCGICVEECPRGAITLQEVRR